VLSSYEKPSFCVSSGSFLGPEILQYAEHVDLPGLKSETVIDLKLDGNKEAELYRLILVAQCNSLHRVMPFLFERIDDKTELLLPDHLLHSDSLIRALVNNLDEEDCESVEVLVWLYQFYIAERKDQVMGRKSVVPTEDIPAVTQLFTPYWIVRYLVENSLGRRWLLNRPDARPDIAAFLSYTIGCMMGRYRLDQPGLIYVHSGNVDFEKIYSAMDTHGRNTEEKQEGSFSVSIPCLSVAKFFPDEDGIIPLLATDWGFPDDATRRTHEFLRATFGEATLTDNLRFIEPSLGKDLRKYFLTDFYKDHLQTYKKRPIYWLFSSGKQRAFQCLVYLHRYHVSTLARMRTEYTIPLQGRITPRIDQLEGDKVKASSTSHRKQLQKEQDDLKKQQAELLIFEEKLKHAADHKISLDLDDGVKVNYGKFGDLLAESKAITGGKDDDQNPEESPC